MKPMSNPGVESPETSSAPPSKVPLVAWSLAMVTLAGALIALMVGAWSVVLILLILAAAIGPGSARLRRDAVPSTRRASERHGS